MPAFLLQVTAAASNQCYDTVQRASDEQCTSLFAGGTCSDDCNAALASAAMMCGNMSAFADAITGAVNLSDEVSNQIDMLDLCPTDFDALFSSSGALPQQPRTALTVALLAAALALALALVHC